MPWVNDTGNSDGYVRLSDAKLARARALDGKHVRIEGQEPPNCYEVHADLRVGLLYAGPGNPPVPIGLDLTDDNMVEVLLAAEVLTPAENVEQVRSLAGKRIRMKGQREPGSYRVVLTDEGVELHYEGPNKYKPAYRCGRNPEWINDILKAKVLEKS